MRIGVGYDIHRFEEEITKNYIMLGGVKISHPKGISAHSDGDVAIHAIIDALLGACALGDIGAHFPDTDPAYKGVDSRLLLRETMKKINAQGYRVGNVDVTIIAEAPKLQKYIPTMREYLSGDCHISINDLSIKAKTNEGLDSTGNQLSITAHAVVLLLPL